MPVFPDLIDRPPHESPCPRGRMRPSVPQVFEPRGSPPRALRAGPSLLAAPRCGPERPERLSRKLPCRSARKERLVRLPIAAPGEASGAQLSGALGSGGCGAGAASPRHSSSTSPGRSGPPRAPRGRSAGEGVRRWGRARAALVPAILHWRVWICRPRQVRGLQGVSPSRRALESPAVAAGFTSLGLTLASE